MKLKSTEWWLLTFITSFLTVLLIILSIIVSAATCTNGIAQPDLAGNCRSVPKATMGALEAKME